MLDFYNRRKQLHSEYFIFISVGYLFCDSCISVELWSDEINNNNIIYVVKYEYSEYFNF